MRTSNLTWLAIILLILFACVSMADINIDTNVAANSRSTYYPTTQYSDVTVRSKIDTTHLTGLGGDPIAVSEICISGSLYYIHQYNDVGSEIIFHDHVMWVTGFTSANRVIFDNGGGTGGYTTFAIESPW